MNTTVRSVLEGSTALKRLADNAKLPTVLYIRVVRAWKAVSNEIETATKVQQKVTDAHHKFVEVHNEKGDLVSVAQFKSYDDGIAYRAEMDTMLADEVELAIKPIEWPMLEEAVKAKVLDIAPADVAALDWLIVGLPE